MRENIFHEEMKEFIEAEGYKREKLRRRQQLDAQSRSGQKVEYGRQIQLKK